MNIRALLGLILTCTIFLIGSTKKDGLTCRARCGDMLGECSCHSSCVSLLSCCPDYNRSCLQVTPHSSSMLGGRALRILGLDLHPSGQLLCRFKDQIEVEGFIDAAGQAYCISPLLYETGWIPFTVSTDGINVNRSGQYLSVHPSNVDPASEVTLVNVTQWNHYGTSNIAGRLKMTWNSSLIGAETVNIELWGYREFNRSAGDTTGSLPLQAQISYLYSLGKTLPNTGVFSFTPKPSQEHSDWELGNIRITASSKPDGARDVQGLWSSAHLLAWHLGQAFRDDSVAWATNKCLQWDVLEKRLPNFLEDLIDCPCTIVQARADTGRFHPDRGCDIERGSVCIYHPGSVHCVRSTQASLTHGSGQQCCYDSTGALMFAGDTFGGSTPDRAHEWGSPPYGQPPRVPGYSHWIYDIISFYHCCLWSDHCQIYLDHRPSTGCRNYKPPKPGIVLGDPHFITFDGLSYTFNGKGEFYLVSSQDRELTVQVRTDQVKLKNGTLAKATQMSSVAMKEKVSDVVEVRLYEGHLQVLRNHQVLPFTEQTLMDLHGAFVFSPSPQEATVILPSGAAVEVSVHEGIMVVSILLPAEFTNQTQGLLGSMNSDPSDDLLTQRGELISSSDAKPEEIFLFGASWNISKRTSLFTYDSKYLLDNFYFPPSHHSEFVPAFSLPERPDDPLVADMLTVCSGGGAAFCKYDTLTTRSLAVGNATLRVYQNYEARVADLIPVVSCGWLPTPRNGRKKGTHYLEGNTLSFACSEGHILYGSAERTCLGDGTWTGEQPYCVRERKMRNQTRQ
ncbi:sushi domain-containing protein 2 isoform X2 [Antennarius striatus]|uniref:sushi domain-containing protein 2 isoform X2 n=1 Tax=Antennarius striatus TaxID=241820 RepID=UPI0035B32DC3